MKIKILWISRHSPTPEQKELLEKQLEVKVDITQVSCTIKSPYEVRELIEEYKADDVVVVLPKTMQGRLCNIGIYPIEPQKVENGGIVNWNNFMRIQSVRVVKEPLKPYRVQTRMPFNNKSEEEK